MRTKSLAYVSFWIFLVQISAPSAGSDGTESLPEGWSVPLPMQERGYQAAVALDVLRQDPAIRLHGPSSSQNGGLGSLLHSLDAKDLRGQLLRLQCIARVGQVAGASRSRVAVWLRIESSKGPPLFFEQETVDPTADWQSIEILGAVPQSAEKIHVGLTLYGSGEAWIDEVELASLGPNGHVPPGSLTEAEISSLLALSELYGAVRFFHPSDGAATADWEEFLIAAVDLTLPTASLSEPERGRRLAQVFLPIAPSIDFRWNGEPIVPDVFTYTGTLPNRALIWNHRGVGFGREETYTSERQADETLSLSDYPRPLRPYQAHLGGDLTAMVPLAVYADRAGTLPRLGQTPSGRRPPRLLSPSKPRNFRPDYDDRTTRIAATILLWNVLEHFYPYFDQIDCRWEDQLRPLLQSAAQSVNREAFLQVLQEAVSCLKDGHADVHPFYNLATDHLPVTWQWLDDELVVTQAARGTLHRGDRILAIDQSPTLDVIQNLEKRISSPTPHWKRRRALDTLSEGPAGESLRVSGIRTDGSHFDTEVSFWNESEYRHWLDSAGLAAFHKFTDGMIYIDTSRVTDIQMQSWIPQMRAARGLILDMRGYPKRLSTQFLEHIVERPTRSLQWNVPLTRAPHRAETEVASSFWTVHPKAPRITCPIAVLQNENAISRTETYLAILKESGAARLFGSTSAATNGNSNAVVLPGDFRLTFTGMEVRQTDGSRFHGVGISPHVVVEPIVAKLLFGRDEVLETARTWVRSRSANRRN